MNLILFRLNLHFFLYFVRKENIDKIHVLFYFYFINKVVCIFVVVVWRCEYEDVLCEFLFLNLNRRIFFSWEMIMGPNNYYEC